MPRIPQGEFDQNPSSRVGAMNVHAPETQGVDNLGKGLANLTGAMAALQDQAERTEAYSTANKVKQDYLQKKATYMAALESSNGSGVADFFDPNDTNPDITKRKRIQRPVQEMYTEMVQSYEESKKEAGQLTRGDIAHDLMRQYVGDDLIQLQMQTSKHINRVREKEVEVNSLQNIELNLSSFAEQVSDPSITPEQISLQVSHMNNKIQREIGTVANILGTEKTKDVQKLLDRSYGQYATTILSTGVTNSTVLAAESLVGRIKDPSQKTLAMTRLENVRRATGEVKAVTTLNTAKDMTQTIVNTPVLGNEDYAKVVNAAKNTFNIYIDPKYSTLKEEDKVNAGVDLLSTGLAKRMLQENAENDLSFLTDPASDIDADIPEAIRAPSGEAAGHGPKTRAFLENIGRELDASGLSGMLGNAGVAQSVRDMTLQKMRALHGTMKDDVADVVSGKYPSLVGRERFEKIHQIANAQSFGYPSLVGKKERTEFQAVFKSAMAKDPMEALGLLNQKLSQAGEAYEGEASYKRAMAIDLADKDQNLAYLIPMADADQATQFKMAQNAAQYKRVIDETDVSATDMQANFEINKHRISALQPLMKTNPSLYDGIKQAVLHSAATRIQSKSDVNSAVQEAMKEMSELYSSKSVGRSSFFAVNRPAKDFNKVSQVVIEKGMSRAVTLPQLSDAEKMKLIAEYNPKVVPKREDGSLVTLPREKMDYYLQHLITIEPDGRFPNVHNYKINGAKLDIGGRVMKISADQILEFGQQSEKDTKSKYTTNSYSATR